MGETHPCRAVPFSRHKDPERVDVVHIEQIRPSAILTSISPSERQQAGETETHGLQNVPVCINEPAAGLDSLQTSTRSKFKVLGCPMSQLRAVSSRAMRLRFIYAPRERVIRCICDELNEDESRGLRLLIDKGASVGSGTHQSPCEVAYSLQTNGAIFWWRTVGTCTPGTNTFSKNLRCQSVMKYAYS